MVTYSVQSAEILCWVHLFMTLTIVKFINIHTHRLKHSCTKIHTNLYGLPAITNASTLIPSYSANEEYVNILLHTSLLGIQPYLVR